LGGESVYDAPIFTLNEVNPMIFHRPPAVLIAALLAVTGLPQAYGETAPATPPEVTPALEVAPAAVEEEAAGIPHVETTPRSIEFSGLTWLVKDSAGGLAGPGPNQFSADEQSVWVDDQGRLHLTIAQRDGIWYSTEVITQIPTGYGEYEFQLTGAVDNLDPNAVLGLFTWDTQTWQTDANSEIDIELTRWSDPDAENLHYAVHPGWGPDTESGKHPERFKLAHMSLDGEESTHAIHWSPTQVTTASYQGAGQDPEKLIARFDFDDTNPPRVTRNAEGETSDPIVIPKPSATTNARINLWLNDANRDRLGDPPTDGQPIEVIISGFRYTPAEPLEDEAGPDETVE